MRNELGQFVKGNVPWHKGKKCEQLSGKNNGMWKDEEVCYAGIHIWVVRHKGKPKICEHCGTTNKESKLNWANTDHKYKRNLNDFISLCVSCHRKYDIKYNNYNIDGLFIRN